MAQGLIKKSKSSTTAAPKRGTSSKTKPGPRQIAPKKASLIKQRKLNKKFTSGLVTKTERSLAQKARHLEMLAGGKKDKQGDAKKKKN